MILIRYSLISPTKGKVYCQDFSPRNEDEGGLLVDSIPSPENIQGKVPVLFINPETKKFFFEYEDIPKTQEEIFREAVVQLLKDSIQ